MQLSKNLRKIKRGVCATVTAQRGIMRLYRMSSHELTAHVNANLVFLAGQNPDDERVVEARHHMDEILLIGQAYESSTDRPSRRARYEQVANLFLMDLLIADLVSTDRARRQAEREEFRRHPHGEIIVWAPQIDEEVFA